MPLFNAVIAKSSGKTFTATETASKYSSKKAETDNTSFSNFKPGFLNNKPKNKKPQQKITVLIFGMKFIFI